MSDLSLMVSSGVGSDEDEEYCSNDRLDSVVDANAPVPTSNSSGTNLHSLKSLGSDAGRLIPSETECCTVFKPAADQTSTLRVDSTIGATESNSHLSTSNLTQSNSHRPNVDETEENPSSSAMQDAIASESDDEHTPKKGLYCGTATGATLSKSNLTLNLPEDNLNPTFLLESGEIGFLMDTDCCSTSQTGHDKTSPASDSIQSVSNLNSLEPNSSKLRLPTDLSPPQQSIACSGSITHPTKPIMPTLASLIDKPDLSCRRLIYPQPIPDGFINMTDLVVPDEVATLLSFGPQFVPPHVPNFVDVYETLFYLSDLIGSDGMSTGVLDGYYKYLFDQFTEALKGKGVVTNKDRALREMLTRTKRFFECHPEVCVVQADKGKRSVLMTKTMYQAKMDDWVNGCVSRGVYTLVPEDFSTKLEQIEESFSKLRSRILSLQDAVNEETPNTRLFPRDLYDALKNFPQRPVGLPYLYGTIKLHKPEQPCRPIVSTQRWYTYTIQKIVASVLKTTLKDLFLKNNVPNASVVVADLRGLICVMVMNW